MAIEPSSEFPKTTAAKQVYVINKDSVVYEEEFKGEFITVPPFGERSLKMPQWKAEKFLQSAVLPKVNAYGENIPGGKNKMLEIVSLIEKKK